MIKLLIVIIFFSNLIFAEELVEYDYELDLYYSNVSVFIDLDSEQNITDATTYTEYEVYKKLTLKSFSPNIFLVEASICPMPIAGLYFRKYHEDLYEKSVIEDFNMVQAITAGFEEPYSLSFFLGRMMVFKKEKKKDETAGVNRAYMGYMLDIGNNTIKDNRLYSNKWMRIEYKLKGTKKLKNKDLDWSFRVGTKINSKSDFSDTIYIGARRSSTDFKKPIWSFQYNSAFSSMIAVNVNNFKLTEAEFMLEKKFPISWIDKGSFGLGIGYLYTSNEKYNGRLKDDGTNNQQFLIRPNLTW